MPLGCSKLADALQLSNLPSRGMCCVVPCQFQAGSRRPPVRIGLLTLKGQQQAQQSLSTSQRAAAIFAHRPFAQAALTRYVMACA